MFSRASPRDPGVPEHDALPLRIVTAVVVVGLIAGGIAVVWADMATRGGLLVRGTAIEGRTPSRPGRAALPSARAGGAGLRLLDQAAAACRSVAYEGVQLTVGHGPDGTWSSVVNVWHQPDRQTLVQSAAVAVAGPTARGHPARAAAGPDPVSDDPAEQRDPEGVMGMTPKLVTLLATNYRVSLGGESRVAGRLTREVVLRHAGGALAARFWLDNATKLPLRRELLDARARVVSEETFINLQLGPPAAIRAPAAAAVPRSKTLASAQLAGLRRAGWPIPGRLPGGLTLVQASETGGAPGPVVALAYSDGLSVISLFLQRGYLPAQLSGWSRMALRGQRVYAADADERSLAWSARGFVFTLIADAPDQTVQQVVGVLPHSGLGFFGRLAHGLHRLATLLNPFR
jgi:sigma-E factor negative regulatory protein RseB